MENLKDKTYLEQTETASNRSCVYLAVMLSKMLMWLSNDGVCN